MCVVSLVSMFSNSGILPRFAGQDDACSCGGLIELYKQHVFKDNATKTLCNAMLQSALDASRNSAVADALLAICYRCKATSVYLP